MVRPADSICRVSEDTSFPVTIGQNTSSPKFSPVSSPGGVRISGSGQRQRASFRLVVNLQSPKSEHIRRLSSDTSSLEDAGSSSDTHKRPICPGYQSPKDVHRSSPLRSSPLQQCRDLSAQPGIERKLRPRPQKDAPESETTTRRSLRLITKNTDVTSGSLQMTKTDKASASTPNRYPNNSCCTVF